MNTGFLRDNRVAKGSKAGFISVLRFCKLWVIGLYAV